MYSFLLSLSLCFGFCLFFPLYFFSSIKQAQSWIRWFVQCSNCMCLCDDIKSKRSERYFSLRAVVSNIADNKYAYNELYNLIEFSLTLSLSYLLAFVAVARKLNLISNDHFPPILLLLLSHHNIIMIDRKSVV